MALGDRKLTHADEAVHFAGVLVAEQRRRFAETHRQIAVAAAAVQIDLILERAGHRTQGEALLRLILRVAEDKHTVEIVIPVAGDLVKLTLGHERRLGQQVSVRLLDILDPALQQLNDARTLRQQNGKARPMQSTVVKYSSSRPSLLWSRLRASACSARYWSSSSFFGNATA